MGPIESLTISGLQLDGDMERLWWRLFTMWIQFILKGHKNNSGFWTSRPYGDDSLWPRWWLPLGGTALRSPKVIIGRWTETKGLAPEWRFTRNTGGRRWSWVALRLPNVPLPPIPTQGNRNQVSMEARFRPVHPITPRSRAWTVWIGTRRLHFWVRLPPRRSALWVSSSGRTL